MSYTHVPFSSLYNQPGLVSLDAARSNPAIVYRSVNLMYPAPAPKATPIPVLKSSIPLLSLAVAQARSEIKYRREGYEMQEHRRHILAFLSNYNGGPLVNAEGGQCAQLFVRGWIWGARRGGWRAAGWPTDDNTAREDRGPGLGLMSWVRMVRGWARLADLFSGGLACEPFMVSTGAGSFPRYGAASCCIGADLFVVLGISTSQRFDCLFASTSRCPMTLPFRGSWDKYLAGCGASLRGFASSGDEGN
ncbi:hypothetical protein BDW22DRAFT_1347229 [Trametopsis cervina]|nr:hypothetical protein BDW22DRAFT_1347229 [Trametopsis cervina]